MTTGIILKPGHFITMTGPWEEDSTQELVKYEALRELEDQLIEDEWQLIRNDGVANLWAEDSDNRERYRFHVTTVLIGNDQVSVSIDIMEAK